MTSHDLHDQVLQELERLQPLVPDLARAERVRAQCRAKLAQTQPTRNGGFGRRVLAPVVVLSFCALYVASLIGNVLRLRGVL